MQKEITRLREIIREKEALIEKLRIAIFEARNTATAYELVAENIEDKKLSEKVRRQFREIALHLYAASIESTNYFELKNVKT